MLAAALVEYGVTKPVDVVYRDVWHRIERVEESFAIVEALRRNGYGIHLGASCGTSGAHVARWNPMHDLGHKNITTRSWRGPIRMASLLRALVEVGRLDPRRRCVEVRCGGGTIPHTVGVRDH